MIKNSSIFLILQIALLFLAACDQRSTVNLEADRDLVDVGELQIHSETMNDIIQNMASPIDVALLIHSLNIPFSESYLVNPDHLSTSTPKFEMAYSLGILHADLGYLNMYEKTGTAINHLNGIRRLANALEMGQFFDESTINQLANTSPDRDSLLFISINSFNNMDDYLRQTDRGSLSAMMIAGVWMEELYQATQVAAQNNHEALTSMIGEQKLILTDLLLILNNYKNEQEIQDFINDLEIIKSIYNDVKITYKVDEPQTIEQDGMLMVVQPESSDVSMSSQTLEKIIEVTEQIRNIHLHIGS